MSSDAYIWHGKVRRLDPEERGSGRVEQIAVQTGPPPLAIGPGGRAQPRMPGDGLPGGGAAGPSVELKRMDGEKPVRPGGRMRLSRS